MGTEYAAPRGTRDILPGETEKWRFVEEQVHRTCADFGYAEVRTPLFEHSELFSRLGEATDLVQKEMYSFDDRGGRGLTLRPEGTAPVARAYLQHRMDAWPQPVKLYYISPMFRYERPQAGRYRQHHQFGAEALGTLDPAIDAEVIMLAVEFYRRVGLSDLSLELNSIGCPVCRPGYREELSRYFAPLLHRMCGDCQVRFGRNVLRMLDCKQPECREVSAGAPRSTDHLCPECRRHLDELVSYLEAAGLNWRLNPRLVRGIDYYTKTVFEVSAAVLGADRALGGGGRYDGLIAGLGGPDTPAVGFGLGLDRLLIVLEEGGLLLPVGQGLEAFLACAGEGAHAAAFKLLMDLRRAGVAADMDFTQRSLKAQMKAADHMRARYVVIVGQDELARGKVILREMSGGAQSELEVHEVVPRLAGPARKSLRDGSEGK